MYLQKVSQLRSYVGINSKLPITNFVLLFIINRRVYSEKEAALLFVRFFLEAHILFYFKKFHLSFEYDKNKETVIF